MNKVILVYHGFGDDGLFMNVKINDFSKQINFLLHRGYKNLYINEIVDYKGNGFCITIDDGLMSAYDGIQFLEKNKIKYCVSLIFSKIGTEGYLTMEYIRNLNYCSILSHSMNHLDLTLPLVDIECELLQSKMALQQLFNTDISTFVYPYGKFDAKLFLSLKKYGYKYGLSLLPFSLSGNDSLFSLPRININGYIGFLKFCFLLTKLGGLYLKLAFVKRQLMGQSYLDK